MTPGPGAEPLCTRAAARPRRQPPQPQRVQHHEHRAEHHRGRPATMGLSSPGRPPGWPRCCARTPRTGWT
ncbi:hypothetical protein QJS66_15460 [Kocuria rhizophila]|nr:hypothetical protein QJS66_15460 [Kocuria rhizophila]